MTGSTPPALQIDSLTKRYPTGTEALKQVSLQIQPGEFFGLLGPNGAGKSTLIHCSTGLARPSSGSIQIFGHDAVNHYRDARQAVGLAPQELNLDFFLTVEETLDYHGGYFGMPRRDRRERAAELLEAFSLTDKRHERTRSLSGGMKRRITLARALMHRPRLLILDEPTAGVDIELRLELWRYIERDQPRGHDDPADDALSRGGRADVQPHRLHQRRSDRRSRHERHAGRALRGQQPGGRLPGARRPPGAVARLPVGPRP